jgi:hypothetical protein
MKIELVQLTDLRQRAAAATKAAFVEEYPGVFLAAMGLLSAQFLVGKGAGTVGLAFGARLRHQVGETHPLAGLAFFLRSSRKPISVVLGRGVDSDLTIPDPSVSERHCRIQVGDEGVQVVDLGSTNGTNINLARLVPDQAALLGDEDILTVGRYSFQVLCAATCHAALRLLETIADLDE